MIYKNVELYNVAGITDNGDGSISWIRVPYSVYDTLEARDGKKAAVNATGVEIRFVIKSGNAVIKMSTAEDDGIFHVYRGAIQGGWDDHEVHKTVSETVEEYVIEKSENAEKLKIIAEKCAYDWDSEVVRIIFDRGRFKIYGIEGDIEPPCKNQTPKETIMSYGSSITHGSNSIDMSHAWTSVLAHNLNMDIRNLGMPGCCFMEPQFAEYIASEGEKGNWDIVTLELGINVTEWTEDKIIERVDNIITTVAGRNKDKAVFVISPFYYYGDEFEEVSGGDKWRRIIKQEINKLNYKNVTYISGVDIIEDISYLSADLIHPNIYGVTKIADKMTKIIVRYYEEMIK